MIVWGWFNHTCYPKSVFWFLNLKLFGIESVHKSFVWRIVIEMTNCKHRSLDCVKKSPHFFCAFMESYHFFCEWLHQEKVNEVMSSYRCESSRYCVCVRNGRLQVSWNFLGVFGLTNLMDFGNRSEGNQKHDFCQTELSSNGILEKVVRLRLRCHIWWRFPNRFELIIADNLPGLKIWDKVEKDWKDKWSDVIISLWLRLRFCLYQWDIVNYHCFHIIIGIEWL
jgi:hypothetical protein